MTNEEAPKEHKEGDEFNELALPVFLRRVQPQEGEGDPTPPTDDFPPEEVPTLEKHLEAIRRLGIKIETLTEQRRILKKQAEGMLRKL